MKLPLLSFALAANLLFAVVFSSLSTIILHTSFIKLLDKHAGIAKSKAKLLAAKKPSDPPKVITAVIESYSEPKQGYDQIIEATKITPSPTTISSPTTTPSTIATSYPPSSYTETYKQAGAKFGIPWQILFGIHQTETGCRNGPIFNRSGSGAQGPMQFMPGTWRTYGVDGNGDGVADINNAVDAIYSAANFLARHGSILAGLRAYGGDNAGVLAIARSQGFSQ